ncbi:MAG: DUF6085 family protein [Frankiaceae bacterium]|jgi:hypothetical protein
MTTAPTPTPYTATGQADQARAHPTVAGHCPMGCGATLFLGSGGYVTCSYIGCPEPDAVATLLADGEPEHIVVLEATTFTVRHPLRERLRDELMECALHDWVASLDGPPRQLGRYRVAWRGTPAASTWSRDTPNGPRSC